MTLSVDVVAAFSADGAETFEVDADFEVQDGETVVILGPSGSGKTLLLETIAGFHDHSGAVHHDGALLSDVPPEDRDFGFVFQDYALFPHMTVIENVGFGPRVSGGRSSRLGTPAAMPLGPSDDAAPDSRRELLWRCTAEGRQRLADTAKRLRNSVRGDDGPVPEPAGLRLLHELGVADLTERYPPTLSGGEQQRVALARALAVNPEVLLLDEPLSSLDVPTRQSLRADLQDVLADVTAVYVTHDRTTARALADRIVVMHDGHIVQTGTATDVFEHPESPLVARFTGSNCLRLDAVPNLVSSLSLGPTGEETHLTVRPEHVTISESDGVLSATVERVTREESTYRVTLSLGEQESVIEAFTDTPPQLEAVVSVSIPADAVSLC